VTNLNIRLITGFAEHSLCRLCHAAVHLPFFEMGGEGDPPYSSDWSGFFLDEVSKRLRERMYDKAEYAVTMRHIAGTGDLQFSAQPHVSEQGKQHVLEMKSRRSKILKQASMQFDGDR